jgi:hypothetical protein
MRYMTPDVVADFTSVKVDAVDARTMRVSGAEGEEATSTYKVSIAYRDGFMASGTLTIAGPDAVAKAKLAGDAILRRLGIEVERGNVEVIGSGACAPGVLQASSDPPEVVMRVSVHDSRKDVVERFAKEFAPLVTSGPPGVTGYTTGRPPVREVFAYWPALIEKSAIESKVEVLS